MARIGQELGGTRRSGVWAAAACASSSIFTYYAQTTNLEVPYLFWSTLALEALVRALSRRDLRSAPARPASSPMAVATKDQAYAVFLAGLPLAALTWLALDPWARARSWPIFRELALGACLGLALLAVVDGAVTTPTGFADRVRMLLGSAGQDHAFYAKSTAGRVAALRDTLLAFPASTRGRSRRGRCWGFGWRRALPPRRSAPRGSRLSGSRCPSRSPST